MLTGRAGRITRIAGDPDHPLTRGFLCLKVNRYRERLDHPDRILHPLRRVGAKGEGRFERVTWSDALSDIAARLRAIVAESGGEAVLPYSFAGNMGLLASAALDDRFFARLGASQLDRTICTASGNAALRWVFGTCLGPDPETIPRARTIVLWGANAMATNVHQVPLLDAARAAGAEIWSIDPLATATAERYGHHLQPRPGRDLELALGLGRELVARGVCDEGLVRERAEGFPSYLEQIEPWTLRRTAEATGLEVGAIAALVDRLAAPGPLLFRLGYGVQRQRRSATTVWAIAVLSLLTGSWREVGGGLLLSNGDAFPLRPLGGPARAERHVNMVALASALHDLDSPPVRALVVYNANPAATAPDQARVVAGLERADLFTVVHEQMMTDTARFADYVLPAAMAMEVLDVHTSYWHRYVQLSRPAAPPAGESVSNPEFFRRLAAAMGMNDPHLRADDESLIRQALDSGHPWLDGITFETLLAQPVQKVRLAAEARPFLDTPVATPNGRFRLSPPPGAVVGPPPDDPAQDPYPFAFLTPAARETIKSTFGNVTSLRRGHPRPELLMAIEDMERLGIAPGARVRVVNGLGEVELTAVASAVPAPGTVVSYAVRWHHEDHGRNVNRLTPASIADFGGGATFYSARVAVQAVVPPGPGAAATSHAPARPPRPPNRN